MGVSNWVSNEKHKLLNSSGDVNSATLKNQHIIPVYWKHLTREQSDNLLLKGLAVVLTVFNEACVVLRNENLHLIHM